MPFVCGYEAGTTSVTPARRRVAVIGARRKRQGTGEYVAREFARCGCDVRAIVGTSESTIELARKALRQRYDIDCVGFTSLAALLRSEPVDIVAVCSPAEAHLPQLELAVQAGCHVFSEKPLWWSDHLRHCENAAEMVREPTQRLLEQFLKQGRYLALNTQWPFTLDAFRQLHPQAGVGDGLIERFSMWLSPTNSGLNMLVDSAPHLLSMLYALAGPGLLEQVRVRYRDIPELGTGSGLELNCVYSHKRGTAQVHFKLARCPQPPRPAGYSVNGFGVQRHVDLPGYLLSFVSNGNTVAVRDPLAAAVEDFVQAIDSGRAPDTTSVVDGMVQLQQLVAVACAEERL